MAQKWGRGGHGYQEYDENDGEYGEDKEGTTYSRDKGKEALKISLPTNKEYIDITPKQVFDVMKRLKSFIGREQATYDYQTGKKVELKDGYMVSFHQNEPNESGHYKSHFGRYSEEEYDRLANKFVEENDAEIYIGTYDEDPEISFKVKDKKQAIKLMIDYNQDAIWDNQNGKLIKNKNRDKSKNPMKEE
ncbi:MAG: hypothetical protein J6N93_06230 [Clostridia bacterium]|nr:hypothetical protein [Clostridia bacterium]